jgi:hypothetical protein
MDGHGASPMWRCEGIPDPSEVSSPGKLSVFLISYNLIIRNILHHRFEYVLGRETLTKFMILIIVTTTNGYYFYGCTRHDVRFSVWGRLKHG